jgi:hypothetical protein
VIGNYIHEKKYVFGQYREKFHGFFCNFKKLINYIFRYFILLRPRVRGSWWFRLIALLQSVSPLLYLTAGRGNALPHGMKILPMRVSFVAAVRRMVRGVNASKFELSYLCVFAHVICFCGIHHVVGC